MHKSKRNGMVELFRFLAAIGIATYHFEWLYINQADRLIHFYIFVEFFFVLSGFFLAQNCAKGKNSPVQYVWHQLRKLYPTYLAAFVFSFAVSVLVQRMGVHDIVESLWKAKWEILLCSLFAFDNTPSYNGGGAAAYIPALLLASLILYFLLREHKKAFLCVIGPLLILCGLSRILHTVGNLSVWVQYDGLITLGVVRALADMSIGILAAEWLLPALKKKTSQDRSVAVAVTGMIVCCLWAVLLIAERNAISFSDLVFYIFVFAVQICCAAVVTLPEKINTIFCWLGKLSYPLFLFHYGVLTLLRNVKGDLGYKKGMALFLLIIFLISAAVAVIPEIIGKRKNCKKSASKEGAV